MRILLLLSLLITTITLSAQSLDDLKYDSIVKIPNSDFSLIYHKKKTAVWHDANFYVVKPTKNIFVYLESAELLVEVDTKKQNFYAIVTEPQTGGFKRFFVGKGVLEEKLLLINNSKVCIEKDSLIYDKNLIKVEEESIIYNRFIGQTKLEILNKHLIVTDYKMSYDFIEYMPEPIQSIEFPGEDSIYGCCTVYKPLVTTSISNSGVYNFKEKKWIIEPIHTNLFLYKDKVLASTNNKTYPDSSFYTLYELNKKGILTLKNNITTNDQYVVEQMTDFDSIHQLNDDSYYITFKNNKQGLNEYRLFDEFKNTYYKNYTISVPINDFVYYSVGQDESILKKGDYYSVIETEHEELYLVKDSIKVKYYTGAAGTRMNVKSRNESNYYGEQYDVSSFGFNQINDSLLLIYDFIGEYQENYPLTGYYGDDSITFNEYGEMFVVYPAPEPGQYHCGVYNLKQNNWVLNNEFYDVQYFGGSTILVQSPEFDENHLNTNFDNYNIYDLNGNLSESNLSLNQLLTKGDYLKNLLTSKNESLQKANLGFYSKCKNCELEYNDQFYYVSKNDKYKIIENESTESLNIQNLTNYNDFVWINRLQNVQLKLDDNDLFIDYDILDTSFRIESNESSLQVNIYTDKQNSEINKSEGLIELITNKGTDYYFVSKNKTLKKIDAKTFFASNKSYLEIINFSKSENEIIISNENPSIKWEDENYDDPDFGFQEIRFEWTNENAVIWKKENDKWIIKSPFYNKIEKTNFGYIVKTGMCNMVKSENYDPFYEKYINSEFILMDSTLKPINIADYFNFSDIVALGFGYKIQYNMNGKYFLIDLNGIVLTDAIYDDYILEDSKIYGINHEIIDIDEFGDETYDEYGNLIIIQKASKTFIKAL
jgi:hypothetical protein